MFYWVRKKEKDEGQAIALKFERETNVHGCVKVNVLFKQNSIQKESAYYSMDLLVVLLRGIR